MARARTAVALATLVGALYFGFTAARDLQPFDSTELVLNAVQLGVGHPPGQPLYLLLAAGAVRLLGFVTPSLALALLSAAATVAAAGWAAAFALRRCAPPPASEARRARSVALVVGAGCGPFLLPGVWDLATRAEVYPLAALLVAGAAFVALAPAAPQVTPDRPLATFALVGGLLGLGASVNPAMAFAGAVALTPVMLSRAFALGPRRGVLSLAVLAAAGIAGLMPYGLLPILGAHPRSALVWGEPLRGDSLAFYLLGRDYRAWRVTGGELAANLGASVRWMLARGTLPWLALGSLGLATAPLGCAGRVALPLGALAAIGLLALNHPFIPSNPDYDGYVLPWTWLSAAGVGSLVLRQAVTLRGRLLGTSAITALLIAGLVAGPPVGTRRRRQSGVTRLLASRLLQGAPPKAMLILESDHLVFAGLYLQEVERLRPDVTIVNLGWTNSSWYWRWLRRREPDLPAPYLAAPSREARVAAFLRAAGRPVAGERLRLAALGGGACMEGVRAVAGALCGHTSGPGSPEEGTGWLRQLAARALPHSLDERLLATTAIGLAEDLVQAGQPGSEAWALLRASLDGTGALAGLREAPPDDPHPTVRTPLTEPRALLPQGAVLLRLGDLLAATDARAAAEYYRRADLPEADTALARLAARPAPVPAAADHPADLAP